MTALEHVRRYAVVGNPVQHSLSPSIHQAFAKMAGISLDYERLWAPLHEGGFEQTMRSFFKACPGNHGLNVTVPFKQRALALADHVTPWARRAGAANTLRLDDDGQITAHNTDGVGLLRALQRLMQQPNALHGASVLMLGAGGAVAGVLPNLIDAGVASITLVNRQLDKAEALLSAYRSTAPTMLLQALSWDELAQPGVWSATASTCRVVIQASSAPLHDQAAWQTTLSRVRPVLSQATHAYDMVYGQPAEMFTGTMRELGIPCLDGLNMLVEQAAAAFQFWHGEHHVLNTAAVIQSLCGQEKT